MEFEDAPIVGRPELRRGYDFIAGIKGQKGNLLQLKSGSQEHGKSYHPEVRVLYEGNFQDFNYKRLDAKLAFYDRAIAKGLEDPDSIDILNKYVLKTVRVEFDRYSEYSARINDIRIDQAVHALRNSVQYDGQTFASRADRRKFEKTQRKQAKSRKGRLSSSSEE